MQQNPGCILVQSYLLLWSFLVLSFNLLALPPCKAVVDSTVVVRGGPGPEYPAQDHADLGEIHVAGQAKARDGTM
jgi:hypothetical protein